MSFMNLKVTEPIFADNSIVNYQYHTHQPYAATTFNNNDEIRIPIQAQDVYTLPSQSYIYIEGSLWNMEDKVSTTLKIINNGIAFLFDEIRYELGGMVIDRTRNPGITSTLKGYASYTSNQSNRLENGGWNHHSFPRILNDGKFSACIPLSMLLGVAEDFQKIILNTRQELVLIRSNTDENAVCNSPATGTDKPKLVINKIAWKMPHVSVSDSEKIQLLEYVDANRDLSIAFRSWELHELPVVQKSMNHTWTVKSTSQLEKPRFIIFGFQTNKKNKTNENMSKFNHCNLTNIKLYLNSDVFPYDNLNIQFDKKKYAVLYEMYAQFQQSYYYKFGRDPCLNHINYEQTAPIVVIDCSRQSETIKHGSVDIRLEFETSTNVPENTSAYCLILHDRLVKYNPLTSVVKVY